MDSSTNQTLRHESDGNSGPNSYKVTAATTHDYKPTNHNATGNSGLCPELSAVNRVFSHQVVLLVVHLGRVSPHAVDGQQQVHEGKRSVQPQQIRPENKKNIFIVHSFYFSLFVFPVLICCRCMKTLFKTDAVA